MSVAIIADAHLGGPGGEAGPLVEQLRSLPARGCRHLVLLGDLFQAWVGFDHFETAEIAAVVPELVRLRNQSVRVEYVEGNRDFFLAGSVYKEAFDVVGSEVAFEVDGRRCLAIHGDGLIANDRQYRFWRWASKSALTRFCGRRLPPRLARRIAHSTERRLADTNFEHKVRIPEEAIVDYAAGRLAEGYDLMLLGHFHQERRWQLEEGEIWLLEAWFTSRRVEWLGPEPAG